MPAEGSIVRPRAAASLVIVRGTGKRAEMLLGRRRKTQAFAPGKYVFPGGSLDAADEDIAARHRLDEPDRRPLLRELNRGSGPATPEAFALAAIRETFEETGLVFGRPGGAGRGIPEGGWSDFHGLGFEPDLAVLSFIGRAITPPGRPRRFDARFFLVHEEAIVHDRGQHDGEFEELVWLPIADRGALDLHAMTQEVAAEAGRMLALTRDDRRREPVPFWFQGKDGWGKVMLERD